MKLADWLTLAAIVLAAVIALIVLLEKRRGGGCGCGCAGCDRADCPASADKRDK